MSQLESYRDLAPFAARELVSAANALMRNKPELELSERTLRYYVSQELLPPPEGPTKFARYSFNHLVALAAIRFLQDQGISLDRIRAEIASLFEPDSSSVLALTIEKLSVWLSRQNNEFSSLMLNEPMADRSVSDSGGYSRLRRTRPVPEPPRQSDRNMHVRSKVVPLREGHEDQSASDLANQVRLLSDLVVNLHEVVLELKQEVRVLSQQRLGDKPGP
jgi:DNA-binding transcriptional MerR regulator